MRRFLPKSLLGQMLLAVGAALLVAQGISALLLYRAAEQRRETGTANALVFQLVAEPRFDYRQSASNRPGSDGQRRWQRLRVQRTTANPLQPGEARSPARENMLRTILLEQGIEPAQLFVTRRKVSNDAYVMGRLRERGLGEAIVLEYEKVLQQCDFGQFAGGVKDEKSWKEALAGAEDLLKRMEKEL